MSSGLDVAASSRLLGVDRQGLIRRNAVTLDRQAKAPPNGSDLREADTTDLRASQPKVTKTEGDIRVLRIDLGRSQVAPASGVNSLTTE